MRFRQGTEVELKRVNWHFFLLGSVQRQESLLVLDTGAPGFNIDATIGAALGPPEVIEGRRFSRSSVSIGGQDFGPLPMRWLPPSTAPKAGLFGLSPQPGLLGLVPLRGLGAVLDCARAKLWIAPRAPQSLGQALAADEWARSYDVVPLLSGENRLRWFVPVTINGHRGFLLVDTGLGATTILKSAADRVGLAYRQAPEVGKRRLDAQGNVCEIHQGVAKSVVLGESKVSRTLLEVGDLPGVLETLRTGTQAAWGEPFGLLGNDTLDLLEAVIDCGGERMFVRRR